ncbi:hypothetical protein SAY87_017972 [Trapa incisa]|uniref:Uncharacterized protein n=1 Tax=Trapa incisa TaxID=236973 RepID=A0AAN7QVU0_9MYRT|nr:hypothetical protein SAY87_017972 [Trapa incisa]
MAAASSGADSAIMASSFPALCLLLLLIHEFTLNLSIASATTVHDILRKYGLPAGLIPESVNSYTLSPDGRFAVDLEGPCYIKFDYLVYYDRRITGKLSYGSITNLKGIKVQRFLILLSVDEIRVDLPPADFIYFQVGLINKKLDVEPFENVLSCRGKKLNSGPCGHTWARIVEFCHFVDIRGSWELVGNMRNWAIAFTPEQNRIHGYMTWASKILGS